MSQGRPYPRKDSTPKQRVNEQIRISEVLVIDEKGVSRGVMPTKEALKLADSVQLDLVEVAPNAKPPVCRILDYGKYKYQQNKKAQSPQSNQIKTKEVRLSPNIGAHDLQVRINQARGFINDKCKVQITMSYTGREITHLDKGEEKINELVTALQDIARIDSPPKRTGRKMLCIICPLSIPKTSSSNDKKASSEETASSRPASDSAPRPPRPAGDRPRRPAGSNGPQRSGANKGSRPGGSNGNRPSGGMTSNRQQ